ncbi:MAG TPA: hypothetical protein VK846_00520 [Candidatus Limnocylindria bacterium]|nr:hypothetical protein [Candidatus Limnocylindria bacterium]
MSMLILGIMVTGVVGGYMQAHRQAEWSAYSLAANSLAMQPIEQARAAQWDLYKVPPKDDLTNMAAWTTNVLDIPINGTNNIVWATNRTTVTTISTAPPLKEIKVECTWAFMNRGVFTNTVITYRAPDQ